MSAARLFRSGWCCGRASRSTSRGARRAALAERRRLEAALGVDARARVLPRPSTPRTAPPRPSSRRCAASARAARPDARARADARQGAAAARPPAGRARGRALVAQLARASRARRSRRARPPRRSCSSCTSSRPRARACARSSRAGARSWRAARRDRGLAAARARARARVCASSTGCSRTTSRRGASTRGSTSSRATSRARSAALGGARCACPSCCATPSRRSVSGALDLARHRIGGDERRAVALARAELREAVARGQLYDNARAALTGLGQVQRCARNLARRRSRGSMDDATRMSAVAHVARGFVVVGVVERFGAFVELVARALDPRGRLGARRGGRASRRSATSRVSTTRVIAALEPALVRSASLHVAYEWRVYEAAIATFRAQRRARLGPERRSRRPRAPISPSTPCALTSAWRPGRETRGGATCGARFAATRARPRPRPRPWRPRTAGRASASPPWRGRPRRRSRPPGRRRARPPRRTSREVRRPGGT